MDVRRWTKPYWAKAKKMLNAYLAIAYSLLFILLVFSGIYIFQLLGQLPPSGRIQDQGTAEQLNQIENSELGRTGGMPVAGEPAKNTKDDENAASKKTPLDYLLDVRDLHAQEGVWRASYYIAVVAIIQTIIGIGGLWLITLTLFATRKTLAEAAKTTQQAALATDATNKTAEAAQAAERAYLFIEFESEVEGDMHRKVEARVFVHVRLCNYGHTPAKNVIFEYVIATHGVGGAPMWPVPEISKRYNSTQHPVTVVGPSNRDTRVRLANIDFPSVAGNQGARVERIVAARVSYDTVFYDRLQFGGNPEYVEDVAFRLIPKGFIFASNKRLFLDGFDRFTNYNFNSVDGIEFEPIDGVEFITVDDPDETENNT